MENKNFKKEIGGRELQVEFKKMAEQASGNCLVRYGDTVVMATAVMAQKDVEGKDFFPLTVEFEEKFYAAGKILGSRFLRRENRPSEEAILTARAIDRAIRPRFPKDFKREVQVVITCLSWDGENDPDVIGLMAASLALSVSNIPWEGPIAAVRTGKKEDRLIFNPTYKEREEAEMEMLLTAPEEDLVNMIEMEGSQLQEEEIMEIYDFVKPEIKKLLDFQKDIIKEMGEKKAEIEFGQRDLQFEEEMRKFLGDRLEKAVFGKKTKAEKSQQTDKIKEDLFEFAENKFPGEKKSEYVKAFLDRETDRIVHQKAIEKGERPDGRKPDQVREITGQVGILPRTHGSGLFSRGITRALSILTLGSPSDVKMMEGMEVRGKKRFMHHYNFPPYCSGEIKPMRGPGRREIGHGMLAEKALTPLIPDVEEFPYTIRVVTEILSSNGSTSMASVSAASLALMDAGVPIKEPATGIAIGLMSDQKGNYKLLADIQGPEDHHGDMDFKVAGTKKGITAIQLDVKVKGISREMFKEALELGKKSRLQILETMEKTIPGSRKELSQWAPRIYTFQIKPDKIREVIGPGGKIINEIIETCEVSIDIEDSGKIFITAEKEEAAEKALSWIKNITREVKPGEVFQGKVKRILNFGAFVEILPGQEGLVHISQLAPYRVEKVEDIVKVGDMVPVKVLEIDEQGRINLSIKALKNGERGTK